MWVITRSSVAKVAVRAMVIAKNAVQIRGRVFEIAEIGERIVRNVRIGGKAWVRCFRRSFSGEIVVGCLFQLSVQSAITSSAVRRFYRPTFVPVQNARPGIGRKVCRTCVFGDFWNIQALLIAAPGRRRCLPSSIELTESFDSFVL